jgi:hypothetical protein
MTADRRCALVTYGAACVIAMMLAPATRGASIQFSGTSADGHAVAAVVDVTLNPVADAIDLTLKNTTALTLDAGELFTGIDFIISGLTPSLAWAAGVQRTVNSSGAYSDTASPQSLSWSIASLGSGVYQLNFNPNAKDGIIGPPTAGSYAAANGSIKGNAGHNPFAAETASFQLSVPGMPADAELRLLTFRFGTSLAPATGTITSVPEPGGGFVAGVLGAGLYVTRRVRLRAVNPISAAI